MSASVKVTIDDVQFPAINSLKMLDAILEVLNRTRRSYNDDCLYQSIREATEELRVAVDNLKVLNPNARPNHFE